MLLTLFDVVFDARIKVRVIGVCTPGRSDLIRLQFRFGLGSGSACIELRLFDLQASGPVALACTLPVRWPLVSC
jgi:hypothetical protein